jgi:hypothetical protein
VGDVLTVTAGTYRTTAPLVTAYSDVDRGSVLVRVTTDQGQVEVAISYGNLGERAGITAGNAITLGLEKAGAYKAEYEERQVANKKSENRGDYGSDAIFANFRAVKMGTIGTNVLYRSAHPAYGDARAPYVAALAEKAGIRTIIDLSDSDEELTAFAATSPWFKSMVDGNNVVNLNMGVDFESSDFAPKLKTGLLFLADHKGPYLVHCHEGKDRTGIVMALLEAISGAPLDNIVADYMVTYSNYFGVENGDARYSAISRIIPDTFKTMNKGKGVTTGNVRQVAEKYLTGPVGLSSKELVAVKDALK